ncbi:hypothetical protein [Ruficoccus sp. ZRK36]|uniref:hypothetical protein n=1 Tax=Ruficoccus sp. ZRK36 TaxID=2866311 RepID=UPI001C737A64|nr:hypothetical protein [Ruficoccus sp. ZRK36]QYY34798.1 hypothetical protein K0V07_10855 [Ruficoccus sp. ZRK36]QYY37292.1 hypothetical protein K0V07_07355 [Ruficoccus sp. ZRK36]
MKNPFSKKRKHTYPNANTNASSNADKNAPVLLPPDCAMLTLSEEAMLIREALGQYRLLDLVNSQTVELTPPTFITALQLIELSATPIGIIRGENGVSLGFWLGQDLMLIAMFDDETDVDPQRLDKAVILARPSTLNAREHKHAPWKRIIWYI